MYVDFNGKRAEIQHFNKSDLVKANELYKLTESRIVEEQNAVVLVSVADMKTLLVTYPSYFLDAKEFINALKDFEKRCEEYDCH